MSLTSLDQTWRDISCERNNVRRRFKSLEEGKVRRTRHAPLRFGHAALVITVTFLAGGLTLGEALNQTGLAAYYVQKLDLTRVSPFTVTLIFGYLCVVMSNFMSNTGTAALLIPVGIRLLPGHALEIAVTTALCASFAVLLPVSTPPNAIVFSTGYLKQPDFRRTGVVVGLLGPLLTLLYLHLM